MNEPGRLPTSPALPFRTDAPEQKMEEAAQGGFETNKDDGRDSGRTHPYIGCVRPSV
jgi:hypothetical protein